MQNNSRLDIEFKQSHRRVKCRSGAPGHGITKSVSRTTTMQGFILTAITATVK